MSEDKRPRNEFVKCVCGITYISGYTHCPKCGLKNPNDKERKNGNNNNGHDTVLL